MAPERPSGNWAGKCAPRFSATAAASYAGAASLVTLGTADPGLADNGRLVDALAGTVARAHGRRRRTPRARVAARFT